MVDVDLMCKEGWGKSLKGFSGFYEANLNAFFKEFVSKADRGHQFFQEGYVSRMIFHPKPFSESAVIAGFQARCHPSMRKGTGGGYPIKVALNCGTCMVVSASCSCPAGLSASCQHVAAVLHMLIKITSLGVSEIPEGKTCTDLPCIWIRPSAGTVSGKPISTLGFGKIKRKKAFKSRSASNLYDPRSDCHKEINEDDATSLFKDLQETTGSCAFVTHFKATEINRVLEPIENTTVTLLLPEEHVNDCEKNAFPTSTDRINESIENVPVCRAIRNKDFQDSVNDYIQENYPELSPDEVLSIERRTRGQNQNPEWHKVRAEKMTASNFGRISKLSVAPDNCLRSLLYDEYRPTAAMTYGSRMEEKAAKDYVSLMTKLENPVTVIECGLFVCLKRSFLSASPDRIVMDHNLDDAGLLEIKCPFSKKGMTIYEAIETDTKKNFCLKLTNNVVTLKRTHNYYYQVQGCLGVTGRKWCDFFLWNGERESKQHVERILFDADFWNGRLLPSLEHFLKYAYVPEKILGCVRRGIRLYNVSLYMPFKRASSA